MVDSDYHVGCTDLLNTVRNRVKPKFHIFGIFLYLIYLTFLEKFKYFFCMLGHGHEDYGAWASDTTNFINAAICDRHYKPINKPFIFDLDKP